jgi:transposase
MMKNHIPLAPHDTAEQLAAALKDARDPVLKMRLRAVILRKKGSDPQEIAASLLISDRAVRNWVLSYNEGGTSALIPKPAGRKEGNPKWDAAPFVELCKEIDKGGYWSIPKMQEWIETHHRKAIPEQTVWYRMDQLHYSYKGARPHPAQGNKARQEAFKKGGLLRSWSR